MTNNINQKPDKRWWMTTDPKSVVKPKGTPWYAMNWTVTILVLIIIPVICFLMLFGGFMNPPPARHELKTLFGKIIKIQRAGPQILLRFTDGKLKSLELPTFLTMGKQNYYVSKSDSENLIGCDVEIRGVPIYWVLERSRFRVYELICREKSIFIGGLEKETEQFNSIRIPILITFFLCWFLFPVPLLVFIVYRDRKLQHVHG